MKIQQSLTLAALLALVVSMGSLSAVNAWTVITPQQARTENNQTLARQVELYNSINTNPAGSVLINGSLNEWCIENCQKLSQIDSAAFATEKTQLEKIARTNAFLDKYDLNANFYCEAKRSLNSAFNC